MINSKHAFWAEKIRQWECSSKSHKDFCIDEGLNYAMFGYYRRKFSASAASAHDETSQVVEINLRQLHGEIEQQLDYPLTVQELQVALGQATVTIKGSITVHHLTKLVTLCQQLSAAIQTEATHVSA